MSENENVKKAKDTLQNRRLAYANVFNPENVFLKVVLEDLAKFCRANETTFHDDPRVHAALEGRREVWLRIQEHLKIDLDTLWKIYNRGIR